MMSHRQRHRWSCPNPALTAGAMLLTVCTHSVVLNAARATEVQRLAVVPARVRQSVSLRDRLVVGLQARLKSEVDFVELVALRVQTGQLPQRLVDETFFWARQRAATGRSGKPRRPIIFFRPAMALRAERLGVEL